MVFRANGFLMRTQNRDHQHIFLPQEGEQGQELTGCPERQPQLKRSRPPTDFSSKSSVDRDHIPVKTGFHFAI